MNEFGIYSITNIINGKRYIGSTGETQGFDIRWDKHLSPLRNNKHQNIHLQSAWNKYGKDNFIFEIVCECSEDNLIEFENYYIKAFNTMDERYGYNFKEAGPKGKMSEETKKRISKSLKGREFSEEHCRKLSEQNSKRVFTDEIRKNMSNAQKKYSIENPKTDEYKKKMSISCKGKIVSYETRIKMGNSRRGKKHSDEAKSKMREAKIGKKLINGKYV